MSTSSPRSTARLRPSRLRWNKHGLRRHPICKSPARHGSPCCASRLSRLRRRGTSTQHLPTLAECLGDRDRGDGFEAFLANIIEQSLTAVSPDEQAMLRFLKTFGVAIVEALRMEAAAGSPTEQTIKVAGLRGAFFSAHNQSPTIE